MRTIVDLQKVPQFRVIICVNESHLPYMDLPGKFETINMVDDLRNKFEWEEGCVYANEVNLNYVLSSLEDLLNFLAYFYSKKYADLCNSMSIRHTV